MVTEETVNILRQNDEEQEIIKSPEGPFTITNNEESPNNDLVSEYEYMEEGASENDDAPLNDLEENLGDVNFPEEYEPVTDLPKNIPPENPQLTNKQKIEAWRQKWGIGAPSAPKPGTVVTSTEPHVAHAINYRDTDIKRLRKLRAVKLGLDHDLKILLDMRQSVFIVLPGIYTGDIWVSQPFLSL